MLMECKQFEKDRRELTIILARKNLGLNKGNFGHDNERCLQRYNKKNWYKKRRVGTGVRNNAKKRKLV